MQQVITIGKDGSMSGLQRKPGQGVDLRQFGKADIQRASLIEWDAKYQRWYINVLQTAGLGEVSFPRFEAATGCTRGEVLEMLNRLCPHGWASEIEFEGSTCSRSCLMFGDYDDAVKVEIAYLDALRLNGHH